MLVLRCCCQHGWCISDGITFVCQNAYGGSTSIGCLAGEYTLQQTGIQLVMRLLNPECFGTQPVKFRILRI